MKILTYIRIILGVLTLLGSVILLFVLSMLFLQDEVNEGYLVFFLVISYLVIAIIYTILNFSSKEELITINRLREENVELELKIQQIALRNQLENITDLPDK